jgi:Xaa-Pro aminopeptidase
VSRADRVAERLTEREVDLLLVTGLTNLRYVTGFTGSNGFAVIGRDIRRFVTDFRYVEQAAQEVDGFDIERGPRDFVTALAEGWPEGELRLGFEDDHVTVRRHSRIRDVVPDRVELVAAGGVVEALREVKESGEIERIRVAAALADEVYGVLREQGLSGRTERDVAVTIEEEMRRRGADAVSFPPIVASAERGAKPHAVPEDVAIPRGTLVTLDIGARLDGYCSDCTRTWATGELPHELAEAYALVQRAQAEALAGVRPGPEGREVDAVARRIIEEAGHGEHFGHGLGHGVGLEVHEAPRLAQTAESPLVAGNVVTVEPGVYLPGVGGVRIEDLVVVTEDGHRVLSGTTKNLVVVE